MPNPLTRKLELFGELPAEDRRLLDAVATNRRSVPAKSSIIQEGDAPSDVHLVLSGFACRSKVLANGRRQIFAYLVPGDFCDLHVFILKRMDHSIETLSPCEMVAIPRARVLELTGRPAIARALWWSNLVDEATLREWLVNLGQRDAVQRIAHLFCELHLRLASVGLARDGEFSLPISQSELGDTMGLSTVHVNRALQSLRRQGLIGLESHVLTIPDIDRLRKFGGFNPNYLHLEGGKTDRSPTGGLRPG
ncbi:CRP-like cAMP-binding protein [Bradyrhizobium yuanmingense]|uniref:Crp/Fnr family transcriptional regulator n=1 Tax=Bradyrhizobium yuanmingense TaxID=108015 RepID=UPI003511320B